MKIMDPMERHSALLKLADIEALTNTSDSQSEYCKWREEAQIRREGLAPITDSEEELIWQHANRKAAIYDSEGY